MSRPLLELVVRAQLRRLRAAARRRRLATVVVALAWLAAPVAAWRVGAGLGATLATSLDDARAARALALGMCLAAAALGGAGAVALPGRLALGAQVASSPISRHASTVAVVLPVVCGCLVLLAPTAAAAVIPLVAPAAGVGAAVILLAAVALAIGAGACGAESVLQLARRRVRLPLAVLGWSSACCVLAVTEGTAGLIGEPTAPVLVVAALAATIVSGAAWVRLAGGRPEPAARRARARPRTPRPSTILPLSALALLWRSAELRLVVVAAASFGVIGFVTGVVNGAPRPVALLLGGGSCAVAVSLVPLSVRGRIDAGAWAWRAEDRLRVSCAWATGSVVLVVASLVPVSLIAATAGDAMVGAGAQVAALAAFTWAAALTAGALVPRRHRGAGDDALSLAAFTAVAVSGGGLASLAGRALGGGGVPDALGAALVLIAMAAGAVTVLDTTLRPT